MVGCCHKAVVCGGTRRGDGVVGAHETEIHGHQCTSPAKVTSFVIWAHEKKIYGDLRRSIYFPCNSHIVCDLHCLLRLASANAMLSWVLTPCSTCRTWTRISSLLGLVCYNSTACSRIVLMKHGWHHEFTCGMRHSLVLKLHI